ncbi:Cytochrome c4 [uncultured Gammaproteobacteria bacterium]|nr:MULTISPECIES: cytochrome c4 [sulfur-oxidizing symbionts]CAC5836497.1 Cytochrome c4 [uncultured Gammaproteobacteria bacterium]CAB5505321.1 Cytochrome c4 [Bathymodiolus azoricus thioautotrophic gill symbiont]CAB5507668.1 Cytochrome c4 [Bathymodiolus thermophilus thioautotrophic gill symbiont]CAC9491146.1 Cytochrome c4 [uncultured Gammaproteobacteria bacterium]CAC9495761.1 Cytochrome c4 [uncultured Gammaproteobacteria bacterium]
MNKLALIFTVVLALISTYTFAAGDATKGQTKAVSCVGCHGVDGNSLAPTFPKLAGQNEGYLLKQLKDFKSGARIDSIMATLVTPLTDADMADLAAYYAIQKVSKGVVMQGANLALGQKIYRGGKKATDVTACIACHGPAGKGIPSAGFPALASQHSMYTVKQLKAFRQHSINAQTGAVEPSRTNDYEGMMINFTKSLTNAEIDAVSAYISGL